MIKLSSRTLLAAGLAAGLGCCALIWRRGRTLEVPPTPYTNGQYDYRWKNPLPAPGASTSAWLLFAGHQGATWALTYAAQRAPSAYTNRLRTINYATLATHTTFSLLHYLQTKRWYDGLAQDVPIHSSQQSVITMLLLIHMLENRRRGVFFGRSVPLHPELIKLLRRYHGYLFSFAIIFTFWSHPMEATPGHLIGFFYSFMMMLQSSLVYTDLHRNPWWTFAQEFMVLPHAFQVALANRNDLAPTFGFGLIGVFLITQIHGLNVPTWVKNSLYVAYIATLAITYTRFRDPRRIGETLRVPGLFYGLILAVSLLSRLFPSQQDQDMIVMQVED